MKQNKERVYRLISNSVSLPYKADPTEAFDTVRQALRRAFGVVGSDVTFSVYRRSVDARRRDDIRFVYTVLAESSEGFLCDKEQLRTMGFKPDVEKDIEFEIGSEKSSFPPIVIGCGPAGMYAALVLAERGYRPILIERGEDLGGRISSVNAFFGGGELDTESNVMFGAGGAGTFSDGKLVTRINDPLCRYVINRLCDFGAPSDIRSRSKPHVGTDMLRHVVANLLAGITELGGRVIFNCRMDALVNNPDGSVTVKTNLGELCGSSVVLAIGHSARDTYGYLNSQGYSMIAKPFSVGVRVEHLRSDIEYGLYGDLAGDPLLGSAEYALSDTRSGRGVYTFCMCPGGEVIAAASERGGIVVNGMSNHARDGVNSNSAVAVSILPGDHDGSPMGAIGYQRALEENAFRLGGGGYSAPIETLGDFLADNKTGLSSPSRIKPSYTRQMVRISDISDIFPKYINDELRRGFCSFGKMLPGFDSKDAILTAVESRTSAPVRIMRTEAGCSLSNNNVYPCGEGAGYAGGITSAAVDGIRTALAIMKRFAPN